MESSCEQARLPDRGSRALPSGELRRSWVAYGLLALVVSISLACSAAGTRTPPSATETPTSPPPDEETEAPTEAPPPTSSPGLCLPDATFVEDVTAPDGTEVLSGNSFPKVWRVRSSGCAPWPVETRLVFVSGDRMGAPQSVPVPRTALGSTADVVVVMHAPVASGTYRGSWQMEGPDGVRFGDQIYVSVVVSGPSPEPGPPSISFVADRYGIHAGECVTISWLAERVAGVYYDDHPVAGAGSRLECPGTTSTYELDVQHMDGTWETRGVTINVLPGY